MKNLAKVLFMGTMLLAVSNVQAQGLLGKLKSAAKSAATSVAKDAATSAITSAVTSDATSSDSTKTVNWDQIPVYTAQLCNVVDNNGNAVKNADGTQKVKVFLVDQFGNKRSSEAVAAQHEKLKSLTNSILKKIGGGALTGVATGLLSGGKAKGALIGAATGAGVGTLSSLGDIKQVKKVKKSLKEQEELFETYSKNFTSEGDPVDASVDVTKIKGLDLSTENTLSMTSEDINKIVSDPSFTTTDDSAWDINI